MGSMGKKKAVNWMNPQNDDSPSPSTPAPDNNNGSSPGTPPSFSHSRSPVRPVPGPSNSHNHSDDEASQSIDKNSPANHHGSKQDRMKFLKSLAEDETYSEILKGLAGLKVCLHPFTISNTNIYPGNRYTREARGWFPRMGILVLGQ